MFQTTVDSPHRLQKITIYSLQRSLYLHSTHYTYYIYITYTHNIYCIYTLSFPSHNYFPLSISSYHAVKTVSMTGERKLRDSFSRPLSYLTATPLYSRSITLDNRILYFPRISPRSFQSHGLASLQPPMSVCTLVPH